MSAVAGMVEKVFVSLRWGFRGVLVGLVVRSLRVLGGGGAEMLSL